MKNPIANPKVSVIVPIYNVERFFARFLKGALGQTYPHIEYIFVDDGSPDRCVEILENMLDTQFPHLKDRVKLIRQENQGLVKVREIGLKAATGEFILFMDSDDRCRVTMVEKMVEKAVRTGADIVICDYFNEYPYHVVPRREKVYPDHRGMLRALFSQHGFRGYLWNKMWRRSLYEQGAFLMPLQKMCDDIIILSQLLCRTDRIEYLHRRLYFYQRRNPGSVSRTGDFCALRREIVCNEMTLYRFYQDKLPSPFTGIERDFLVNVAHVICSSKDSSLYEKYPEVTRCLESVTLPDRSLDLPLKKQRELAAYLKKLK